MNLVPALIYDDAKRAIAFLTEAFGFEVKESYEEEGVVHHAELTYGDGMVMIGNTRDNEHSRRVGAPTSSIYVVVDDPDAHRERARAAGAEVSELTDQDYGSRDYSARDPEGYLWNFGTYQP